uniref:Bifunctional inhibitor/plant lipid transfer protein/seed storage helical domain-containing protein n=1 Tax=Leersia perrieri TaxID=77586 RepID=A0A0D9VX57_9ORYZ
MMDRSSFTASCLLGLAVVAAVIAAPSSAQQLPPPQQQPPLPPQQPPGQPANATPSCPPVQASMSPCVSYFIGNSSSPSDACCVQMREMFRSQAPCLCAAVSSAPSQLAPVLGGVQSLLPTSCNLPPNACADASAGSSTAPPSSGTTAAAPATEPAGTDPATAAAGGGSKTVPTIPASAGVGGHGHGASAVGVAVLMSSLLAYGCMI